ncbi:Swi3-domain-containing protein [Xylariomycetidae sp. FL2044]|nr:Swi3-domain-containing protein [Xylariomycetidae sp. FL2044]
MASRTTAKKASLPSRPANHRIDDYDVDDDVFASDNDDSAQKTDTHSKKRKDASGLGIEEEVAVAKKPRVPNVKLDENRLLSEKGIPRLRRKAQELKFKGKGHEFSDAARLLSFYQLWLDDLFPKAKFVDALAMVEKTGHKKYIRMKRLEWIDEGKPKPSVTAEDDDLFGDLDDQPQERDPARFPAPLAPIFQSTAGERHKTPVRDDVPDNDEDIYGATPRQPKASAAAPSLFGNGGEPDDDDLDALMAEEEAQRTAPTSLFGNGQKPARTRDRPDEDEDDLDALVAEAEAESTAKARAPHSAPKPTNPFMQDEEEDDLDALMAEAEAQGQARPADVPSSKPKQTAEDSAHADEEEVMAEMDGLW